MIEEVKILLGIKNEKQDTLLGILEKNTKGQLLALLGQETVPVSLEFILSDVICARFNRIGNEGMQSYSQEGESISYPTSDFAQYIDIIEKYLVDAKRGRVVFLQ